MSLRVAQEAVHYGGNAFALQDMLGQSGRCCWGEHDGDLFPPSLSPSLSAPGLAVGLFVHAFPRSCLKAAR